MSEEENPDANIENPDEEINEGEEQEQEPEEQKQLVDSDGNPINPEDLLPKEPQNPLKLVDLRKSVKNLQRSYNGLSFAYTELDLREKELDELCPELNNFTELRDFNVSNNKLPHINPIENMPYLIIDYFIQMIERDLTAYAKRKNKTEAQRKASRENGKKGGRPWIR